MKTNGFPLIFIVLLLVLTFCVSGSYLGTFGAKAYAKENHSESKIISNTLTAHKVTCLSRNGSIVTVLVDGRWVDVIEAELVDHTLIIRTNVGNISLAAVMTQ
jgi:hypothetical protein